jgi:hypothetical protein
MISDGSKIVQGAAGTTTTVLHGNAAGAPTYGPVAIASDVSGLGTNVATFLGTPSSANLAAALTDETGSGAAVFANTPSLVTPDIGAATGTSLHVTGTLQTGAPNTGTSGVWKLGVKVNGGPFTLDNANYIELDVGGTLYKLALVT